MKLYYKYTLFLLCSFSFAQETIGVGLYNDNLIEYLVNNFKTNSTLGYNSARDTLYLQVDRNNGLVKGIYTDFSVSLPSSGVDPSTHLYENGMNCEHIWPQSMYDGNEPMKSDMHALRPCKENVNSTRQNKPFNNILDIESSSWYWLDIQTSNIPSSNIDEYSENSSSFFEPREDRKGDIARTIFYFYTMYSNVADINFFNIQKDILKIWHEQDPPNQSEIDRTYKISTYQENKPNPFILDITLIERAYFYNEILIGDINNDSLINVLDIVELINIILYDSDFIISGDLNNDNEHNILDVVMLANLILS